MSTITSRVHSTLAPAEVLRVLTDFGPERAKAWPGVDDQHLKVHDSGPDWADVTEGNSIGWERERYSWDAVAGTVTAVTKESNLWAAGSQWTYALTADGTGTTVDVTLVRHGKGLKGKLIGALLPAIGQKMIKGGLSQALKTDG